MKQFERERKASPSRLRGPRPPVPEADADGGFGSSGTQISMAELKEKENYAHE